MVPSPFIHRDSGAHPRWTTGHRSWKVGGSSPYGRELDMGVGFWRLTQRPSGWSVRANVTLVPRVARGRVWAFFFSLSPEVPCNFLTPKTARAFCFPTFVVVVVFLLKFGLHTTQKYTLKVIQREIFHVTENFHRRHKNYSIESDYSSDMFLNSFSGFSPLKKSFS